MPINQPADGSTNWGTEVRAAIAAVNTLEGVTAANLPETIRDTIGSTVVGTGLVTVTPSDVADTVTVATTATANSSDATLLNRANHTGTQAFSTISDGTEAVQDVVGAMVVAGANTAVTYNDAAGTLTVSASGASGDGTQVHAVGNSGTALTLDAASASGYIKTITLTGNCTFTFTGATAGLAATLELVLTQDATGSRTVTWPASVKWSGGAPVLSTTAAAVDRLVFTSYNGGTTWFGDLIGKGYA